MNRKIGFDQALFISDKMKPEFTYNMAKLEGNTATYAQVETIVHGHSVSGLTMVETRQVDNISRGWNLLLEQLKENTFILHKMRAIEFNMTVSAGENRLNFGSFRNGPVAISGTDYLPPNHLELSFKWDEMIENYKKIEDPLEGAIILYGEMSRNQFFGDGNKRTALLLMNGELISNGFCPITISPKRELEYRDVLLQYYENPESSKDKFLDFFKKEQEYILSKWSYNLSFEEPLNTLSTKPYPPIKTKEAPSIFVSKPKEKSGLER